MSRDGGSKHECKHEFYWYPAINETGWKCSSCDFKPGEPPGFDPKLDRLDIHGKVYAILSDMHDANLVYVSNGSMGDGLTSRVANACHKRNRYDQETIIREIMAAFGPSHARYWAKVSRGVMVGKDPRHRCACGKLATCSSNGKRTCNEHWRMFDEEPPHAA